MGKGEERKEVSAEEKKRLREEKKRLKAEKKAKAKKAKEEGDDEIVITAPVPQ